jgi:hypothetical protein
MMPNILSRLHHRNLKDEAEYSLLKADDALALHSHYLVLCVLGGRNGSEGGAGREGAYAPDIGGPHPIVFVPIYV